MASFGASSISRRISSISSCRSVKTCFSTSEDGETSNASRIPFGAHAVLRLGALRSTVTESGWPGHGSPTSSSAGGRPSFGVITIVTRGCAVSRSASPSAGKDSARTSASAPHTLSAPARERRTPSEAILKLRASMRSSANPPPSRFTSKRERSVDRYGMIVRSRYVSALASSVSVSSFETTIVSPPSMRAYDEPSGRGEGAPSAKCSARRSIPMVTRTRGSAICSLALRTTTANSSVVRSFSIAAWSALSARGCVIRHAPSFFASRSRTIVSSPFAISIRVSSSRRQAGKMDPLRPARSLSVTLSRVT